MQTLFVSGSYQNTSMRIPFSLREHGEDAEAMPMEYRTVPGEEVSPGVSVESHSILHCELLEEEVHTGLAHTLHTAQQFFTFMKHRKNNGRSTL
jgi:hypothetical protein